MQNSYFFFRHLVPRLSELIKGAAFVSCFSQEKDELILEFNNSLQSFFIRLIFSPALSIMVFPETFRRARKNSADIFPQALMGKVTGLKLFENERSFLISLDNNYSLILKMHGASGNVILSDSIHHSYFRNVLKSDKPDYALVEDRVIDWTPEYFKAHEQDIAGHYFTFGKEVWQWLSAEGYEQGDLSKKYDLVQKALIKMQQPDFYICRQGHKITFSMLPVGEARKLSSDPIEAVNEFYGLFTRDHAFLSLKQELIHSQEARIKNLQAQISKNKIRLSAIQDGGQFKEWADLIMANLHQIPAGADQLVAESFHNVGVIHEIRLKPEFSPQKNAEIYYRKSRNRLQEIQRVQDLLNESDGKLNAAQECLLEIQRTTEISGLRAFDLSGASARDKKEQARRLPYLEQSFMGYSILIGRSSAENDELTFRIAGKEDLWLHARDVSGSHVIIRNKPGHNIPKPVIERAAALAAFHSKRKGETLCPVTYTRRKYVRKRKGDPAGMVVSEREEVIMVEPAS